MALDFLDAEPVGINAVDLAGAWAHFRVDDSRSCMALFRQLRLGDTPLSIGVLRSAGVTVALPATELPLAPGTELLSADGSARPLMKLTLD